MTDCLQHKAATSWVNRSCPLNQGEAAAEHTYMSIAQAKPAASLGDMHDSVAEPKNKATNQQVFDSGLEPGLEGLRKAAGVQCQASRC